MTGSPRCPSMKPFRCFTEWVPTAGETHCISSGRRRIRGRPVESQQHWPLARRGRIAGFSAAGEKARVYLFSPHPLDRRIGAPKQLCRVAKWNRWRTVLVCFLAASRAAFPRRPLMSWSGCKRRAFSDCFVRIARFIRTSHFNRFARRPLGHHQPTWNPLVFYTLRIGYLARTPGFRRGRAEGR